MFAEASCALSLSLRFFSSSTSVSAAVACSLAVLSWKAVALPLRCTTCSLSSHDASFFSLSMMVEARRRRSSWVVHRRTGSA